MGPFERTRSSCGTPQSKNSDLHIRCESIRTSRDVVQQINGEALCLTSSDVQTVLVKGREHIYPAAAMNDLVADPTQNVMRTAHATPRWTLQSILARPAFTPSQYTCIRTTPG